MRLGRLPVVYRAVAGWNWLRVRDDHALVRRTTRLVIDGFPSSGNSFSIAALRAAAGGRDQLPPIAHHLHCPGQVVAAAHRQIPILLIVRDPRASVVSVLSRWPHLQARDVLTAYLGYHDRVQPVAPSMVIATFPQVTGDFGAVTERLNRRFGTDLPVFDHSDTNARVVYNPDEAGRAARRAVADARRSEIEAPAMAGLLTEAEEMYARFAALGDSER
jgi:hypothetical protein